MNDEYCYGCGQKRTREDIDSECLVREAAPNYGLCTGYPLCEGCAFPDNIVAWTKTCHSVYLRIIGKAAFDMMSEPITKDSITKDLITVEDKPTPEFEVDRLKAKCYRQRRELKRLNRKMNNFLCARGDTEYWFHEFEKMRYRAKTAEEALAKNLHKSDQNPGKALASEKVWSRPSGHNQRVWLP